jgi:hypothetical protein
MRQEAGAWQTKTSKDGQTYYLHKLDGTARPDVAPPCPPGPDAARAAPDLAHRAYSALLSRLTLSKAHREALQKRGLSDDEIDRRGYRSLPVQGRSRHAAALREQLRDGLLTVPGFYIRPGKAGPYLTVAGAAGLLVPIRDAEARIVALMSRRDDASDGRGKYLYLSSNRHGGPGPGSPPHVPLGVAAPCPVCRLTEGALKADVAFALSSLPTIGAAGLAGKPALDVLAGLGCQTVRLAFDGDALENAHVARALAECSDAAAARGLAVELERWDKADGKGIDDLLAADKAPEILRGDDARQAVAEILAAATADAEPEAPPATGRLREALAKGPEAVYRDAELLKDLARLAEENPGEWQCCRAAAQAGGLRLRDLDAAIAPDRQALRSKRPALDRAGCYRVAGGRIVMDKETMNGTIEVALANWHGRIVEEVVRDDGAERRIFLAVEGALVNGAPLPRVEIAADAFAWMRWPVEHWGARAVVLAGPSTADNLRCALQLLSGDVPRRTVYGFTGWHQIGGAWLYLHAGGAIGADGPAPGVEVALPGMLAGFQLPAPPEGAALAAAGKASLSLLDGLAPDRIMFPLLAAVYRAALGEAPAPIDFSLFLAGPTGAGKTALAALCQQHYGAGLDARHLPGSWISTGNSLEALAFAAKDALLVVDDFAPRGAAAEKQRQEREADRILRAQGNRAGRGRCNPDGTTRPVRPPRGLILSTGEDLPAGHSLRARMLVLEVSRADVPLAALTAHQQAAAADLLAQALAGFLRWLAPRYTGLGASLPRERAALRDRALTEAGSPRTPGIVADLALGLRLFLEFAEDTGTITGGQREELSRRGWPALLEAADRHGDPMRDAEPTARFLRLLSAALVSGRAHLASPDGREPEQPAGWGWRQEGAHDGPAWRPQGRRIGWLDGADLYLEPEAAYAAAQELGREQNEFLPGSLRALAKSMKDKGLLASWDQKRQRNTTRRALEGMKDREVLHLRADALSTYTEPSAPSAEAAGPTNSAEKRTVPADGPADGADGGGSGRPPEPSANPAANAPGGRCGRSDKGGEAGPVGNNSPTAHRAAGPGPAQEPSLLFTPAEADRRELLALGATPAQLFGLAGWKLPDGRRVHEPEAVAWLRRQPDGPPPPCAVGPGPPRSE